MDNSRLSLVPKLGIKVKSIKSINSFKRVVKANQQTNFKELIFSRKFITYILLDLKSSSGES